MGLSWDTELMYNKVNEREHVDQIDQSDDQCRPAA